MHRKEACISCGKISILRCGSKNGMFYTVTNLVLYVVEAGLYGAKKENCKLHRKYYKTANLECIGLRCRKENCEFTP